MDAAKALDREITSHLSHLSIHQKQVVLSVVKTFAGEEDEWWEGVELAAADSIKKGLSEAKEGKTTAHDTVMKKYKKWL